MGLGSVALQRDEAALAWQQLQWALRLAANIDFVPALFGVLLRFGEWHSRFGRMEAGASLLHWITRQEASPVKVKEQAQQELERMKTPSIRIATAAHAAPTLTLNRVVADLLLHPTPPIPPEVPMTPVPSSLTPLLATNQSLVEPLTERELEILHLIAEGHTNHAIADKLILSPGTVKWYSSEIYGKLGVASRMQAVVEARRLKLLE
jgi:LuxR family maltose regulon positive regulatory protein